MSTHFKRIACLLLCVCVLVSASLSCNLPTSVGPVIAVALRYEDSPVLALYIGDPANKAFHLPAGEYYVEAVNSKGQVFQGWREIVKPVIDGGDAVALNHRARGNVSSNEVIASQLQTLADFMVAVDLSRLVYLETASNGFQRSFEDSMKTIQMSDMDVLYASLQEISDQREDVYAALQALDNRMQQAASDSQAGGAKMASIAMPREHLGIWDSLQKFFSFKSEEDEQARQEILLVSASMTPEEKDEAFYWLDEKNTGGARNYDEFLQFLQNGQLQDITKVRSDLYTGGPYQGVYQTLHPESNRPGGETTHRVGAELLQRGANLEFEIVKETLAAAFPGIQKGFEYADKAAEWAEFVNNMYINPMGTLQDMTLDEIQSGIQERIQQDLMSVMPDLDEETAELLSGNLTDEIMSSQPAIATAVAEIRITPEPAKEKETREPGQNVCDATSSIVVTSEINHLETNQFNTRICDYLMEITNNDPEYAVYFFVLQHDADGYQGTEDFDWMGKFRLAPGESRQWAGYVNIHSEPDFNGPVMSVVEYVAGVYDFPECADEINDEAFYEEVSVPLAPVCPIE